MAPDQTSRPAAAPSRLGRGGFSLLLSLVLGVCLLGWMVWDPSERTALQKEMKAFKANAGDSVKETLARFKTAFETRAGATGDKPLVQEYLDYRTSLKAANNKTEN